MYKGDVSREWFPIATNGPPVNSENTMSLWNFDVSSDALVHEVTLPTALLQQVRNVIAAPPKDARRDSEPLRMAIYNRIADHADINAVVQLVEAAIKSTEGPALDAVATVVLTGWRQVFVMITALGNVGTYCHRKATVYSRQVAGDGRYSVEDYSFMAETAYSAVSEFIGAAAPEEE